MAMVPMSFHSGDSKEADCSRKKLIIFDMDSTVIDCEGIIEMARARGVGEVVADVTQRAMNGELDFEQALIERVKLLRGLTEDDAKRVACSVPLMPGAGKLMSELKACGYRIALVSGGFTIIADRVGSMLGMDHVYANELMIQDGVVTGEVRGPLTKQNSKKEVLEEICKLENISPKDCIAVGDGSNDLCWVGVVGTFVAFNAKPVVRQAADVVVEGKNLESLIPIMKEEEDELHAKRTARKKIQVP
ncbi:phosphoserine phosphatase SerB [Methanocella sp. MCL-LM]|uniref:phosphoserine phosphatase SerB n=1 Tax=Methanocella sp. MCL-LM TaxID=3412035 RepID=UPI003C712F8F